MSLNELAELMQKEQMYLEAKTKHPGSEIEICGFRYCLLDCFESYVEVGTILFYYNIGCDTFAVEAKIL